MKFDSSSSAITFSDINRDCLMAHLGPGETAEAQARQLAFNSQLIPGAMWQKKWDSGQDSLGGEGGRILAQLLGS